MIDGMQNYAGLRDPAPGAGTSYAGVISPIRAALYASLGALCGGRPLTVADDERRLLEDLNVAPVDLLAALLVIETRFHIELDDAALEQAQTLADIVMLCEAAVALRSI